MAKPRMAFRVGVTGKRHLQPEAIPQLRLRIREILEIVRKAVTEEHEVCRDAYSADNPVLRAVSPLAEGVDSIFAEEALALGFELLCPLPFLRAEYERDFNTPQGKSALHDLLSKSSVVLELDGSRLFESDAYESVGRVVIDQCDLLIAVWDGVASARKAGTSHIMDLARHHIPVVCLRTDNPQEDTLFRYGAGLKGQELTAERLANCVRPIVRHPAFAPEVAADKKPDWTGSYLEGLSRKPHWLGRVWSLFIKTATLFCKVPKATEKPILEGPFTGFFRDFDAIANRLAGQYRGSFLLAYTFGVAAVFLALLGQPLPAYAWEFTIAELGAIVATFALVLSVRRWKWHHRGVDCRYLAEQFRVLCYLYPLAKTAPPPRLAAHNRFSEIHRSWMEWLLRARIREAPMARAVVSPDYARERYEEVLNWISDQVEYHERNFIRMHCMEYLMEVLCWTFIGLAAAACIAHLCFHEPLLNPWLTLGAAGFPAAAAACHAISIQGQFRRLAERSDAMQKNLAGILEALNSTSPFVGGLRKEAQNAAEAMVEEVADWQILYRQDLHPG